jgi:hypothetical protein
MESTPKINSPTQRFVNNHSGKRELLLLKEAIFGDALLFIINFAPSAQQDHKTNSWN